MNILLASSEVAPFAKTGGLADVAGSLPQALAERGQDAAVIMPAYRHIHRAGQTIEPTGIEFSVPIGSKSVPGTLLRSTLPGSDVPIYFVQQDDYYDREDLYRHEGEDYIDNCERFVFFSRSVLEAIKRLELDVDLVHCNDWQTSLIPAYLATEYCGVPPYEGIATLLTIHNIGYQGQFWHWDMLLTGLDWKYFNWQQMEFYGHLNLLKTGIVFADALNTVSPRYAEEIQTEPHGAGLEGVLHHRRHVLDGILNGADYSEWNPATDPAIAQNYDAETAAEGKAGCKAALQRELGLPENPGVPLLAFIGRLTEQKGVDILAQVMQSEIDDLPDHWVVLGTGDPKYHEQFTRLSRRAPGKVAAKLEFSEALAHRIEAGADMFLMPSRYEPCGLNQLYSLKYGTVPVVRATGGLADTITNCDADTLADGTANGFSFEDYSAMALADALSRAREAYRDRNNWKRLVRTGMEQDWSWSRSAGKYVELYEETIARKKQKVCLPR